MDPEKTDKKGRIAAAVTAVFLIVVCVADAWYAHDAKIKAMQDAGAEKLWAAVDLSEYRDSEKEEIEAILESAETSIRESKDQDGIDAQVEKALDEIGSFKTEAEYNKEEGIEKLKGSVDLSLYREAEQAEIQKILDSTEKAIKEAKDQAEIDSLIEKAASQISEFRTDAEYKAAEAARSAAGSKKKKSSGSRGCVGGGSDVYN